MTQQTKTERDQFIETWERESKTTQRVLNAYPAAGKCDFKPSEKSRSGREMAWSFVQAEQAIADAMKGKFEMGEMPPVPQITVGEIAKKFEQTHRETLDKVRAMPPEGFDKMVQTMTGPGKKAEVRAGDMAWMTLMDTINHRGQLVVYLRILDAKVPSIYGPSADEPW